MVLPKPVRISEVINTPMNTNKFRKSTRGPHTQARRPRPAGN